MEENKLHGVPHKTSISDIVECSLETIDVRDEDWLSCGALLQNNIVLLKTFIGLYILGSSFGFYVGSATQLSPKAGLYTRLHMYLSKEQSGNKYGIGRIIREHRNANWRLWVLPFKADEANKSRVLKLEHDYICRLKRAGVVLLNKRI